MSLIAAAELAVADGALESWILLIDSGEAELIADISERAASASGTVHCSPIDIEISASLRHAELVREHDLPLVLLASAGTLVDPSAVTNLLRAIADGADLADSRVIPLEEPRSYSLYTGTTETVLAVLCIVTREVLEQATATDADFLTQLVVRAERPVVWPAAVVFAEAPLADGQDAFPPASTGLAEYMGMLASDAAPELSSALADLVETMTREVPSVGAFLSVLLLVRGEVGPQLADALLCLAAQSDQDFEVIVVSDGTYPDALERAAEIVRRHPPSFRSRVRLVASPPGSGRALNAALDSATGRYVALLEQDDVVLGCWVETVRLAAAGGNPVVLIGSAVQSTRRELWPSDEDGPRVLTTPSRIPEKVAAPLEMLLAVGEAAAPYSFAFPRIAASRFGLRFDASLSHAEDWDLVHSGVVLFGISQCPVVAVVRRPPLGESSFAARERVNAARVAIDEKVNSRQLLLPPGVVPSLRTLGMRSQAFEKYAPMFAGLELRQPLRAAWSLASPAIGLAARSARRARRRNS